MSEAGPTIATSELRTRMAGALGPECPGRKALDALSPESMTRLGRYCELVQAWNARTNLTGARSWPAFAEEHVADLLPAMVHLPSGPFRFVDVGSGSGLPGIVLAILRPDASGELLEPIAKKHAFLAHAIRALDLPLEARRLRLEDHLVQDDRELADVALSRATWAAASWLRKAPQLVRQGGRIFGFAGTELGDLPQAARTVPYSLGGRERFLVILDP